MTKMQTVLTTDDFDFIIVALNDALLEIVEKKQLSRRKCMIKLRLNSDGYNRPFSPVT
jgi:hypothetical protein